MFVPFSRPACDFVFMGNLHSDEEASFTSPGPVAGADLNRLAPDASFTVSRSEADIMTAYNRSARRTLLQSAPLAIFLFLQRATGAGHPSGFKPPKKARLQFRVHNRALATHKPDRSFRNLFIWWGIARTSRVAIKMPTLTFLRSRAKK